MKWLKQFSSSKKTNAKYEVSKLLQQLKTLKNHPIDQYEYETKERLENRLLEIDELMADILKDEQHKRTHEFKEKIKKMEEEQKALLHPDEDRVHQWAVKKKQFEELVAYGTEFVKQTNFYAPTYVFDINKLQGMIFDMDEALTKKNNPLLQLKEIDQKAKELKQNIDEFKELHQQTTAIISQIDAQLQAGKLETEDMFDLKNELYVYLQQGNLKEAEKTLDKLKRTL